MTVAETRVSMAQRRACCSHSHSLRILLISLLLLLFVEASDVCVCRQLPWVRTFRSVDTLPKYKGFSAGCSPQTLPCLACFAFLATFLALANFSFPIHSFPGQSVDFHQIIFVCVRVCSRLVDASALQVIFCRHAQTIEDSQLFHVQVNSVFEVMHAFFTWSGRRSVPFASSYRLTSSRNSFRRSSSSSILEPN